MSWADPQALWFLAFLPAAVALLSWHAARRKRATEMFGKIATVGPLIAGRARWWRLARATLMLVGVALAIVAFAGPQYGLFTQLYIRVIRPHLDGAIVTEPSGPPRFAQLLGVVFLGMATVSFMAGAPTAGWIVTLIVTALATLAATTRICVGCIIYERATT